MRAHRQEQYTTGNGFNAPLAVRHVYKMQLPRDRNFGIQGLLQNQVVAGKTGAGFSISFTSGRN
jgi:hypothetical protein